MESSRRSLTGFPIGGARDRAAGLAFTAFSDVGGSQAKSPAVDFVGHDALMQGFSERFIQPLQKRGDALIVAAHECGEQSLIVHGDGRAFDRCDSPQHDVAPGLASSAAMCGQRSSESDGAKDYLPWVLKRLG